MSRKSKITDEMKAFLRANYTTLTHREMVAELTKRGTPMSVSSIGIYLRSEGLYVPWEVRSTRYHNTIAKHQLVRYRACDAFIKANYPAMSLSSIALECQVSPKIISTRVKALGLQQPKPPTTPKEPRRRPQSCRHAPKPAVVKLPTRPKQELVSVRLNSKTIVMVRPGSDIPAILNRYSQLTV